MKIMNKSLIILTCAFGLISTLYGGSTKTGSSPSERVLHQVKMEKKLYDKLANHLKKQSKDKDVDDILSDYDTALMGMFDLAISIQKKDDDQYWLKLRELYLQHMKDIRGPDAIEGWHEIGEFLKKRINK